MSHASPFRWAAVLGRWQQWGKIKVSCNTNHQVSEIIPPSQLVSEIIPPNKQVAELAPPNLQVSEVTHSAFCSVPSNSAPLTGHARPRLEPASSERYTSDGRDNFQSDLCRQNLSVLNELEGHHPGCMANSDSDRGLPYPLHICTQPTLLSSHSTPLFRGHCSIGGRDTAALEEEIPSLLQKQVIFQIPTSVKGVP